MPTRLPEPPAPASPAPALPALASAWLAGLIVLAAVAGTPDGRDRCAAPTIAGTTTVLPAASVSGSGSEAAVREMLTHD